MNHVLGLQRLAIAVTADVLEDSAKSACCDGSTVSAANCCNTHTAA